MLVLFCCCCTAFFLVFYIWKAIKNVNKMHCLHIAFYLLQFLFFCCCNFAVSRYEEDHRKRLHSGKSGFLFIVGKRRCLAAFFKGSLFKGAAFDIHQWFLIRRKNCNLFYAKQSTFWFFVSDVSVDLQLIALSFPIVCAFSLFNLVENKVFLLI